MKKIKVVNNGKTYLYDKQQLVLDVSAYKKLKEFSSIKGFTLSKSIDILMDSYLENNNL